MDIVPQALLFLGVIPALILIFITLKGYDELYKEKTMFIMFIAGILSAVLTIILEIFTLEAGILIIIFFPLIEQMFKTVILNIRRFQEKKETPIYGLLLGVGFGSVFTPFYIIRISNNNDPNMLYIAFLISIALILLHGATGVLIGFGIYKNELTKYFIISSLLIIPTKLSFSIDYLIIYLIFLLVYGFLVYWYVTMKILPKIKTKSRKTTKKG